MIVVKVGVGKHETLAPEHLLNSEALFHLHQRTIDALIKAATHLKDAYVFDEHVAGVILSAYAAELLTGRRK